MRPLISRAPQRVFALTGLVLVSVIGGGIWLTQRGTSAGAAPGLSVTASRGNLVVSVGGVGRIVTGNGAAAIDVPAAAVSGSGSGGSSVVPADAVFPHTSGHLERFLVKPGQHVAAGQPIAVIGDNGAAASAVRQAEFDLATARIELRQRLRSDPAKGTPPTAAEIAAASASVRSARVDLAQAVGPAYRADLAAARLDLSRARADLQTLRGGNRAARTRTAKLAVDRVTVARKRLDRALAPAKPADVGAAQAEVRKAEADLALLLEPRLAPLPAEITAARNAITVWQQTLAAAQAASPPDAAAVSAAQLELDKAVAALATLQRPAPVPLAQEIASAEAALNAARVKLAALQGSPDAAEVAAARQELALAQSELRTLRAGPSAAGLGAAQRAVAAASAKLRQVQAQAPAAAGAARVAVLKAEADMAVLRSRRGPASASEITLARVKYRAASARLITARLTLRQLRVRAPGAGTVTALLTVRGAPVDGSTAIAAVTDLDRLAVRVDLSEFDVARVKPGLKSIVSVDALGGESFRGAVLFAALAGTDTSGVVTFPVTVNLTDADGPRPGMNVSVRIIIEERRDVVQVPIEAVAQDGEEGPMVAVVGSGGEITPRRVTTGLANNKSIEIVRGLRAGERVAVEESAGAAAEEE